MSKHYDVIAMHFLLLNGPPQSGKDTAAAIIDGRRNEVLIVQEKFSYPLKASFLSCSNGLMAKLWLDHQKEKVFPPLGVTPRQFQIMLSEHFFKPHFGPEVFIRLLLERVKYAVPSSLVVVSDCGFQTEYDYLVKMVGKEHTTLWRIMRPGCTFDGDSREYVEIPDTTITNDGNLAHLEQIVAKELEKLNDKR